MTPTRAAVYLRISLDAAMDGLAIDRQRQDCLAIIEHRGWTLACEYVDQSISASDKHSARPSYDRLVRDYEAGLVDAIICWDLDRLTRQPRQLEDWIDRATEHGLVIVTAGGEADLSTDGGRMYARIKASVARAEVERKSARQTRAQRQRAEQGRLPRGKRVMGYDRNGQVIESEAAAIRAMYRAVAMGSSTRSICRALAGEPARPGSPIPDVPTTPRPTYTLTVERLERWQAGPRTTPAPAAPDEDRKYAWIPPSVTSLLRNPRLAGYSTYRPRDASGAKSSRLSGARSTIVRDEHGDPVMGTWEPIVDADLWWRVQDILDAPGRKTNHSGKTTRSHLGSGLYLCGECDKPVVSTGGRYRCPAGCMNRTRTHVDDYVLEVIRARLSAPDLAALLPRAEAEEVAALDADIAALTGRVRRAEVEYDDELITARDLKRVRDKVEGRLSELTRRRSRLSSSGDLNGVLLHADPEDAFKSADLATRRAVLSALCTVRLYKAPRSRNGFDPDTVAIDWT